MDLGTIYNELLDRWLILWLNLCLHSALATDLLSGNSLHGYCVIEGTLGRIWRWKSCSVSVGEFSGKVILRSLFKAKIDTDWNFVRVIRRKGMQAKMACVCRGAMVSNNTVFSVNRKGKRGKKFDSGDLWVTSAIMKSQGKTALNLVYVLIGFDRMSLWRNRSLHVELL